MLLRGVWNTVFTVSVYHLKCRDTWGCGGRHAATSGTPQLLESQWPALVPLDWGRATAGNLDFAEMTNVIAFTQPPSTKGWKCSHCKNISVQVMSLLHAEVLWESLSRVCSPRLNIDSFRRLKSWKVSQQTFFLFSWSAVQDHFMHKTPWGLTCSGIVSFLQLILISCWC